MDGLERSRSFKGRRWTRPNPPKSAPRRARDAPRAPPGVPEAAQDGPKASRTTPEPPSSRSDAPFGRRFVARPRRKRARNGLFKRGCCANHSFYCVSPLGASDSRARRDRTKNLRKTGVSASKIGSGSDQDAPKSTQDAPDSSPNGQDERQKRTKSEIFAEVGAQRESERRRERGKSACWSGQERRSNECAGAP